MFATSIDILYLVLSICALALTVFLCLSLYYFIASAQRIHKIIKRVETGVVKVEEIIATAREKIKNSAPYFMILSETAKRAMAFVQEKQAKRREKKATNKKK